MNRLTVIALATLFAATACSSGVTSTQPVPANVGSALGALAPAFDATALDGSTAIQSSDYHGKIVVLNFWATWCPPCRAEMPDLIRAYGALHAPDVAFVGLDTTESPGIVKSFVALKGVPYQIGIAKAAVYNDFGISYIPTTIVLDGNGVVRARWIGGIKPAQLKAFVANARAGRNGTVSTPQQTKLDRMLRVVQFHFGGKNAAARAEIKRAQTGLDAANTYAGTLTLSAYDFERTNHETGMLALAIANASAAIARTKAEHVAADGLLAAAYADLNRYTDAIAADNATLALQPNDPKTIGSLTDAYYRLHDYPNMLAEATKWTALAPNDSDAWDQVGLANQRSGNYAAAVPAYKRALAIMIAAAKNAPVGDGEAVADIADESLDYANVYVSLGDSANARMAFDQANAYATLIPAKSPYAEMKARAQDRTVEGMAAVAMLHSDRTTISLAPWTGANLPDSLSAGIRYRLIAVAPADRVVTLQTKGLRAGWVASFCQDRLCSPNRVTFAMPATGIKTYEFQLVPPTPGAKPGIISIGGDNTNWITTRF